MIKILLGGSPCTHWSVAQKNNRETQPNSGLGWELFLNYKIALDKYKPDYFLYENNKSAARPIKDEIARLLQVTKPDLITPDNGHRMTHINSALVSAQHRERFYVTNFGDIFQPKDRGILLRDILESGEDLTTNNKAYCLTATYNGACAWNTIERSQRKMVAERIPHYGVDDKARPLSASYKNKGIGEGSLASECFPDNPNKQVFDYVAEPIRIGSMPRPNGELSNSQANRVYSIDGKSVNLVANGGGKGAKTGLYAIPSDNVGECAMCSHPHGWNDGLITYDKSQTITTGSSIRQQNVLIQGAASALGVIDGKRPMAFINKVYEVKDGRITIKGKQYPIKLADGYYIIRKLTVTECKRLQTIPDWYEFPVSDSQAYKMIGNGWTIEVIKYLLSHIPNILNEEIEVLSMYDGMSCGQIALKDMGCNVVKYYATEIDKYAIQTTLHNFPNTIQLGDAFQVRESGWRV